MKCTWKTAQTNALKKYDPAPITDHPCFSKSKAENAENLNESSSSNILADDVSSEDLDTNSIIANNITVMKESNLCKKSNRGPKYLLQDPTPEQYAVMLEKIKQGLPESAFTKHL